MLLDAVSCLVEYSDICISNLYQWLLLYLNSLKFADWEKAQCYRVYFNFNG